MDELDLGIRNHLYRRFVELGRAQETGELAAELGLAPDEVEAALHRLHEGHALVLEPGSTAVRMLSPFSLVETPHRVEAAGRTWYANCAWDAFGIPAALGADGRVSSACPDCGEPIEIAVRDGQPVRDDAVAHFLLPAARWWADIVFT